MTPKIPLSRCRKCPLYHGHCPLNDLDPCILAPSEEEQMRTQLGLLVTLIIGVVIAAVILFASCTPKQPEPQFIPKWSAVAILRELHKNEITEWDKLVLAIAYTESRFRDDVVGKAGDSGILQITEPYVREANRISGANFKHEDAFSIDSSLAMFAAIQDYYNPSHGIDEAIYRHNKSEQYRRTVLENLEMINRYEALRAKLIMTHY